MAARGADSGGSFGGTTPGLPLAALLERAAGPQSRYPALDDGGTVAAAGRWDAVESWCAARKLAAIRELIRRNPAAGFEPETPGAMPRAWRADLTEEIALELGITRNAADALIDLAWTLEVRLPLTSAALDAGIVNLSKARMIAQETSVLSGDDAKDAEAAVAGWWAGKTWSQIRVKIARAIVQVDPEGARKRREQAEREEARVRFWREHAGTAALGGYGLPTDAALIANQKIQGRALAYKAWGIPGTLDQLRVLAYLDKLTDTDARSRYPRRSTGQHGPSSQERNAAGGENQATDAHADDDCPDRFDDDRDDRAAGPDSDREEGDTRPKSKPDGDSGDDDRGPGSGPDGTRGPDGGAGPGFAANVNLTVPLLTMLGLAERPGEAHGLGVLDPDLARLLAAAAARDPRSTFAVTLTDTRGRAIGYGQAKLARKARADRPPRPGQDGAGGLGDADGGGRPRGAGRPSSAGHDGAQGPSHAAGPGRANGPGHAGSPGRADAGAVAFTSAGPGPPGGYGTWTLTIGQLLLTVNLAAIPAGDCDHRHESAGYRPGSTLRRLVEVRDGECTMPVCVRHPKNCDFEHAVPWPEGPTCLCNAGSRCRHDHRIKQSKGWNVEQLPGGLHRWTTPSGRQYTKAPKEYPI